MQHDLTVLPLSEVLGAVAPEGQHKHAQVRNSFKDFLESEHSAENVLFYDAVANFATLDRFHRKRAGVTRGAR